MTEPAEPLSLSEFNTEAITLLKGATDPQSMSLINKQLLAQAQEYPSLRRILRDTNVWNKIGEALVHNTPNELRNILLEIFIESRNYERRELPEMPGEDPFVNETQEITFKLHAEEHAARLSEIENASPHIIAEQKASIRRRFAEALTKNYLEQCKKQHKLPRDLSEKEKQQEVTRVENALSLDWYKNKTEITRALEASPFYSKIDHEAIVSRVARRAERDIPGAAQTAKRIEETLEAAATSLVKGEDPGGRPEVVLKIASDRAQRTTTPITEIVRNATTLEAATRAFTGRQEETPQTLSFLAVTPAQKVVASLVDSLPEEPRRAIIARVVGDAWEKSNEIAAEYYGKQVINEEWFRRAAVGEKERLTGQPERYPSPGPTAVPQRPGETRISQEPQGAHVPYPVATQTPVVDKTGGWVVPQSPGETPTPWVPWETPAPFPAETRAAVPQPVGYAPVSPEVLGKPEAKSVPGISAPQGISAVVGRLYPDRAVVPDITALHTDQIIKDAKSVVTEATAQGVHVSAGLPGWVDRNRLPVLDKDPVLAFAIAKADLAVAIAAAGLPENHWVARAASGVKNAESAQALTIIALAPKTVRENPNFIFQTAARLVGSKPDPETLITAVAFVTQLKSLRGTDGFEISDIQLHRTLVEPGAVVVPFPPAGIRVPPGAPGEIFVPQPPVKGAKGVIAGLASIVFRKPMRRAVIAYIETVRLNIVVPVVEQFYTRLYTSAAYGQNYGLLSYGLSLGKQYVNKKIKGALSKKIAQEAVKKGFSAAISEGAAGTLGGTALGGPLGALVGAAASFLLKAAKGIFNKGISVFKSLVGMGTSGAPEDKLLYIIGGAVVLVFFLPVFPLFNLPAFNQSMIDTSLATSLVNENTGGEPGGIGGLYPTVQGTIGPITLSCADINGKLLSQSDSQWGSIPYGSGSECTIANSGCGPTSDTMILNAFGSDATVPVVASKVAAIDHSTGCWSTVNANLTVLADNTGLKTFLLSSWQGADRVLKDCGLIFAWGQSHTSSGRNVDHFLVITGLNWDSSGTNVVSYNTLDPAFPLSIQDSSTFTIYAMYAVVKK